MNTSLTKKPMKPITMKPNAVCRQILLNSAEQNQLLFSIEGRLRMISPLLTAS